MHTLMPRSILFLGCLFLSLSVAASEKQVPFFECPPTPNCVTSKTDFKDQFIEPIPIADNGQKAMMKLEAILQAMPSARYKRINAGLLHAVFTSDIWGFKDDVYIEVDSKVRLIHFSSRSREGYYDFGVNRRRLENIRHQFLHPE